MVLFVKINNLQVDAKKTWYIMNELIGKSSLYFKFVTDKTEILGETNIVNEFNNFFRGIGFKRAKKIPESSQTFESYMKNVGSEIENKPSSRNELKKMFLN